MQALRYATSASAGALRAAALRPVARAYSAGAGSLHKAQLGNGVTVISDDSASSPVATISVVVKAGSAYETHETHGAAHFAKLLALKSNQSLSALRVTRLIENHSASFEVKHSREAITYTVKSLQEDVGPVCEVLAAMMKPLAQEYELRDLRELVNNECAANVANSESRAADLVHSAVFRGQGLGRSVVCPTYNRAISSDLMGEYVESSFVGERITVVGLGVDKARFTEGAQAFAVLARGSAAAPASSETSFGGEVLESAGNGTRAVLAYPMGNAAPAEAYTALTILGGHLQANKTSPGEGVTSRLYQNVLAKNPSVRTASAVYHNNCVQPLVGVTGFAPGSGKASELVNALHAEVKGLSNVSDEEIKRASATCAAPAPPSPPHACNPTIEMLRPMACTLAFSLLAQGGLGFRLPARALARPAVLHATSGVAVRHIMSAGSSLPAHLSKMLEDVKAGDAQLFDVREQGEYEGGSIALSALVPLSELKEGKEPASADKAKLVYVHCQAGKRAQMAKPLLEGMGFERVVALEEGFPALRDAGLPLK